MDKPTHLLIPIEDIEEMRSFLEKGKEDEFRHGKLVSLDWVVSISKQLFLSQEDIDTKAEIYAYAVPQRESANSKITYKQALKDLLNQ